MDQRESLILKPIQKMMEHGRMFMHDFKQQLY